MKGHSSTLSVERAMLAQLIIGRPNPEESADSLAELERLADTAGMQVAGNMTQRRDKPDAATFMGQGKLAELQVACRAAGANRIIFDNALSSVQVNNLSRALGIPVMDRTELILHIFARRANSAEARMQVELAQLEHQASRVQIAERQQRFHGGIGARGPGENPFQLHQEPMLRRIRMLKNKLKTVQQRRERTRKRRHWHTVCLAGYTNAGKSTLLNAMAGADAFADDRLFATLDTKSRALRLPNGRMLLLTDTVGFIRNLPHSLVASFRSTLEEVVEADMLLVVADATHPRVDRQIQVVHETLADLKADNKPRLLLFNKADMPEARSRLDVLRAEYPESCIVSALTGAGLEELKTKIELLLEQAFRSGNDFSGMER